MYNLDDLEYVGEVEETQAAFLAALVQYETLQELAEWLGEVLTIEAKREYLEGGN